MVGAHRQRRVTDYVFEFPDIPGPRVVTQFSRTAATQVDLRGGRGILT
jgi:hypothetical protein